MAQKFPLELNPRADFELDGPEPENEETYFVQRWPVRSGLGLDVQDPVVSYLGNVIAALVAAAEQSGPAPSSG